MAVLVGDLIMSARAMVPDLPGTLPAPSLPAISTPVVVGATLPIGTYIIKVTAWTPWGESTPSVASTGYVIASGHGLTLTGTMPLGATGLRAYFGIGTVNQYADFTSLPATISAPGTPGSVPTINRAYLMDADGTMFPASVLYTWLQDALEQAGDLSGGIYDATGIRTQNAVAMYQLLGDWKKMTHAWFDGWQLGLGNKGDAFYRNKITAVSGVTFTAVRAQRSIVEYFAVPNRDGGQTTLSTAASVTDTTLSLTDVSSFLLSYGLAQVGTEVVAYQIISGNDLLGCLRGLGGTSAAAWPGGTTISELNGRFAGYRYPTVPHLGDSLKTLDIPPGWRAKLTLFLESRYMDAQKRHREAQQKRDQFEKEMKSLASAAKLLMGPRQAGEGYVNEVYGSGARMGGGWLIP